MEWNLLKPADTIDDIATDRTLFSTQAPSSGRTRGDHSGRSVTEVQKSEKAPCSTESLPLLQASARYEWLSEGQDSNVPEEARGELHSKQFRQGCSEAENTELYYLDIPPITIPILGCEHHLHYGSKAAREKDILHYSPAFKDTTVSIEEAIRGYLGLGDLHVMAGSTHYSMINHGSRYVFDETLKEYYLPKSTRLELGLEEDESTITDELSFSSDSMGTVSPFQDDSNRENDIIKEASEPDVSTVLDTEKSEQQPEEAAIKSRTGQWSAVLSFLAQAPLRIFREGLLRQKDMIRVELADVAQFVVDPVTKFTYVVRQLHSTLPVDNSPEDIFSGMRKSSHFIQPLTHPYSGRKFDVHWFDQDAPFVDPSACMARVKQELLQETSKCPLDTSFLWRNRTRYLPELQEPSVEPWTERNPWLILRHGEVLAQDTATRTVYRLTPDVRKYHGRIGLDVPFPADDPDALQLRGLGTSDLYAVSNNIKIAERVVPDKSPPEIQSTNISRSLYRCTKVPWTQSRLKRGYSNTHRLRKMSVDRNEPQLLAEPWRIREQKVYCDSLTNIQNYNRFVESVVKESVTRYMEPECYIALERRTGKLYTAQRVVCTDPSADTVYHSKDFEQAADFALGRKLSIHGQRLSKPPNEGVMGETETESHTSQVSETHDDAQPEAAQDLDVLSIQENQTTEENETH